MQKGSPIKVYKVGTRLIIHHLGSDLFQVWQKTKDIWEKETCLLIKFNGLFGNNRLLCKVKARVKAKVKLLVDFHDLKYPTMQQ